ncbi:hypothetical protein OsI_39086 [Oryza sativa Indica Group]|uniref:Cytochrome c oxidase assembly factor 3 mitochondrial coiled-coil domain-containing protein n=1 Tax=Oryza sativa subsp. indica TaxID=39946 RepID=A2ZMN0_ORYSI|nr:hypothetical protein OsI_39086 [Oryza sativa Indica Group]
MADESGVEEEEGSTSSVPPTPTPSGPTSPIGRAGLDSTSQPPQHGNGDSWVEEARGFRSSSMAVCPASSALAADKEQEVIRRRGPRSFCSNRCKLKMAGFGSLAPKTKNIVVAGGLSAFVLGVYYYTMRAVGGTDELQVAIDKFEGMKKKDAGNSSAAGS